MWTCAFFVLAPFGLAGILMILLFFGEPGIHWERVLVMVVLAAYACYRSRLEFEEEKQKRENVATPYHSFASDRKSSMRSQWELGVAAYVLQQPGCSDARMNDRSVIVASDGHTPLEIDIYIPELRLGIEADGIRWHDRDAYRRDQLNGTEYSEEMYKERYCARQGIKLIHVWDEDGETEIHRQIDAAIYEQRKKYC